MIGQIRDVRIGLGMTQVEFATWMCVRPRTVQDWEAARRKVPAMAWELIRYKSGIMRP